MTLVRILLKGNRNFYLFMAIDIFICFWTAFYFDKHCKVTIFGFKGQRN